MSGILLARHFLRALVDAGIVPDHTHRVVIDAQVDCVVKIYTMRLGMQQLLKVIPSLEGIKVEVVEGPEKEAMPSLENIKIVVVEEPQAQGDGVADWVLEGRQWPNSSRSS